MLKIANFKNNIKVIYLVLFLITITLLFGIKFSNLKILDRLDETFRDFVLRNQFFISKNIQNQNQEQRFVVIDIDEATINHLNKFEQNFLPRQKIADLIEILLLDYNVKAIVLDIIFTKPAENSKNDERLLALSQFAPIVFAQAFDYYQRYPSIAVGYLSNKTILDYNLNTKKYYNVNAKGYIGNFQQLAKQVNCVGNIGYIPDSDGVLRSIPLFTTYKQNAEIYSHLTLSLLLCYDDVFKQYQQQNLQRLTNNLDKKNFWRIPYAKTMENYTVIPASFIFDNKNSDFKNLLKNKYVLIGSSAVSLGDRTSTPLLALTPGILVHAQILSALLDTTVNDFNSNNNNIDNNINNNLDNELNNTFFPREIKNFFQNLVENIDLIWSCIFVVIFFATLVRNNLNNKINKKISVLVITFFLILQIIFWGIFVAYLIHIFNNQINQLKLLLPINISLFLLLFIVPFEWRNLQKNNQKLTHIFKNYVGQSILDEILKTNDDFLQPHYAEISVLIVDVVDFTKTVESSNLQNSANLIKNILDFLTQAVIATSGTLDKYNGDGLIAFWGAPLADENHAENAILSAIKMFELLDKFNQKYNLNINIRIGIDSGKVLVGDLGTDFRSSYTVLGNCINYASRLENIAHNYKNLQNFPRKILIGESTKQNLTDITLKNKLVNVGKIKLRGSQKNINIYTINLI